MNQWMIDRLNGWMNEWVTGCLKRLSTSMNERTNEGTEEGRKAGREEGRKELGAINGMKEMKEWGMKGWRKECKNEGMKEGRNEGIEERRTEKKENGEMREHMHQWMNLVRSWVIIFFDIFWQCLTPVLQSCHWAAVSQYPAQNHGNVPKHATSVFVVPADMHAYLQG